MTPLTVRTGTLPDSSRLLLSLIADGKSDSEIGRYLGLSVGAVRAHVSKLLSELKVASRSEAVAKGYRDGWLVRVPAPRRGPQLSPKQLEMLQAFLDGRTEREICAQLGIKRTTIRTHWTRIYRRFGVVDRAHAIRIAVDTGITTVPPREPVQ